MKNSEIKTGMWVITIPGFKYGDGKYLENGGLGYKENLLFQVKESYGASDGVVDDESDLVWPAGGGDAMRARTLRPATEWEIEHKQIQKNTLYEIY